MFALQTPEMQSVLVRHFLPVAQGGHEPPQSTSVSSPSCIMSKQVSEKHIPLKQRPVGQAAPSG